MRYACTVAPVVELADTTSLSLVAERRAGSWPVRGTTGCSSAVECCSWEADVTGSNPVIPIAGLAQW